MKIISFIFARGGSKGIKNKNLLKFKKTSLLGNSIIHSKKSHYIERTFVSTDSEKIAEVVHKHGGESLMTSKDHKNGTERIAEVSGKFKCELVVDIQGDEPLVSPKDIDAVIDFHKKNKHFDAVVPCVVTDNPESRHVIKVIKTKKNKILYFSRSKIPFVYTSPPNFYLKDLSIISFKPEKLKEFSKLKQSELEITEGIELLRALENDFNLGTLLLEGKPFSVDVNEDLMKAIDIMPNDPIRKLY